MFKENKIIFSIVGVVFVLLVLFAMIGVGMLGKDSAGLDNRPRWMMGGLRDDTGSHNAKDVFGMGFGLDQTRKGVATVDGRFNVNMGNASVPLAGKV